MPESFDCPRCGAPMQYNSQEQGSKETITCPYCGESVIVPESMRSHAPQVINLGEEFHSEAIEQDSSEHPTVISLENEAPASARTSVKKGAGICVVVALVIVAIMGVAGIIIYSGVKNSMMQAVNPVKTDPASYMVTQLGTMVAQVTEIGADLTGTPMPAPTEAPRETPTPIVNTTATAESEATLAAQNTLAEQQRNWPVVLQEKFAQPGLGWNDGTNNDEYALEEISIANNKYTWKVTSKKSMGSFTFPEMKSQTDMFVSVDMQMTSTSAYDDDQAGIIFRASPTDHSFYFFGVAPKGSYILSMYDGNNWDDLIQFTPSDQIKENQVNHLAVSIQGNQILLMINDTVVNSFEDARLSSGGAGLGMEITSAGVDATVIFSNFYVRAPKP
jgi:DNA-directed RNA polymerase subunit RPC12/RpoP